MTLQPATLPAGESDSEHRRHVVTALVVDRPGTLNRVSGLLRARSFNIESLTVGATHEPGKSRMTVVLRGDEGHLRQVLAQLERLIEVLEVSDLHASPHVELELAIVEVDAPADPASELALAAVIRQAGGGTLATGAECWRAYLAATPPVIDHTLEVLRGYGLRSLVRAGAVAMAAGPGASQPGTTHNGATHA
jgi:acetolactate synthase I/III small subunit